jgi:hypothetical protein
MICDLLARAAFRTCRALLLVDERCDLRCEVFTVLVTDLSRKLKIVTSVSTIEEKRYINS